MIEVFADVSCPFAHVALRTLGQRREALGRAGLEIRVRAWPLELVNGEPSDAGLTADHVAELRAQVAPELFAGFDPARFPRTTLPALALAAAARRIDPEVGWEASLALRTALFEEGEDVARPDVLDRLAQRLEVTVEPRDEASVRSDWEDGRGRGVQGSPHFFCGNRDAFCPSLEIDEKAPGGMVVQRRTDRLDRFLEACRARS